CQQHYSFPFNF
nr:immunoglobulin light chain junction region [Macaca mulatta]